MTLIFDEDKQNQKLDTLLHKEEEDLVQIHLQPPDAFAEGGRAQIHPHRGSPEGEQVGHGLEAAQGLGIREHRSPFPN